ncbi:chondroitinase-B domain-containing protein [Pyxidicoccus xibeiensis]|uniref:chondroitinase-B domain-containing protein n=1 Tax=Pyxidicoccus xibeiensis TaxID=2906759 RepID=UPI0020A74946|nr:chondroitinase-B domain-containing protein [Pyxidicoccus xibeiensis]MCP3141932.1 right-handed parallel beta-helix repeat-containing protein [Pyxidicoccus xibeiensis]
MRHLSLAVLLLLSGTSLAALKNVSTVSQLQSALASAQAGDEIVLADGTYDVSQNLSCSAEGTAAQPIVVRAANRHAARIRFNATEGFKVSGRYWTFDGLDIEGVCAQDSTCEHAFHVTGHAENFTLRNSRVRNFNAQLKSNAVRNTSGVYEQPHRGLIEHNEVYDTRARNTGNPVTKLNIDSGDDWVVRDNYLHDFAKAGGISYGAFMKSGGRRGLFERNLVICTKDAPAGDTRIGLSFGGGGTGNAFCAPAFDANVPCDPEHSDGVLRNNVIINCSDVAIYLNKATRTQVLFNTLIATTGVDFRYASSTGEAHGNVLSSVIRRRDSGSFTAGTNLVEVTSATWSTWYQAPLAGDLRIKGSVSQLIGAAAARASVTGDYCGRPRPTGSAYSLGALEHSLGDCSDAGTGGPTDAGTSGPDDAGTPVDAGTGTGSDAGTTGGDVDAGPSPSPSDEDRDGGGGCGAVPGLAAVLVGLLLPIALRRRGSRA